MERRRWVAVSAITLALALWIAVAERRAVAVPDLHFAADPAREIVLYTTSWCGACETARRVLDANSVRYREVDIERSPAGRRAYQRMGGHGVPVFVIDGRAIHGLDWAAVIDAVAVPATSLDRSG